ncbi:hypothetical protein DPMN_112656 [Dreissena polymorpha]|uniref:Uncharacterized protein n=1 Tax=Dreissena polymorpha TaxID=45954 RepID=A0A9D4KHI3_DREPO|nr:hypothetical protein DPMN_112656 [Dreissena polymorpha]
MFFPGNKFGTFVTDNTQFLVQPPDRATGSHTLSPVKDVLPTETDFLVNPTLDRDLLKKSMSNLSDTSCEHFRNKRQSTAYKVELFFVIDFSLYLFWYNHTAGTKASRKAQTLSTIKQFYAFVLSSMNIRYESINCSDGSVEEGSESNIEVEYYYLTSIRRLPITGRIPSGIRLVRILEIKGLTKPDLKTSKPSTGMGGPPKGNS